MSDTDRNLESYQLIDLKRLRRNKCTIFYRLFILCMCCFLIDERRLSVELISIDCLAHYRPIYTRGVTQDKRPYIMRGQWRPRSDCAFAQSDLGLHCPRSHHGLHTTLTESLDTVDYIDIDEQRQSWCACWSRASLLAYGIRALFLSWA